MVQKNTKLFVIDNSGSSILKCLHVRTKSRFNSSKAIPGVVVVASVRRLRKSIPKKLVAKSKVCFALITSVAYPITRFNGITIKSEINSAVILAKYNKKGAALHKNKNKPGDAPLGNRFSGSVFHEVRRLGFFKVVALARGII